jgi:hypothetical protein
LVTNSTGPVVEIIYDNADAAAVAKGEYPPAYCVIVHFPSFQGFMSQSSPTERYFPFTNRKLVPIYRRQFFQDKLLENIRKLQATKLCYREQFPIDLSTNLTAHRSQGQTWKNCTLSVNLGFESPQNKVASDATSITSVACTRITKLKDLFVSPIFPSVWLDMGKSDRDVSRQKHEQVLRSAAKEFASLTGKYEECVAEMEFKHDFSTAEEEWNEIVEAESADLRNSLHSSTALLVRENLSELKQSLHEQNLPIYLKAVGRERFIGIDQGV